MQKFNFILIFSLFVLFIAGCGKNKTTDETNKADNNSTQSRTLEAGTQYKITFNGSELSPDTIRLTSGVCYQLDFENNGNSEVEFIAGKDPSDKGFEENFFEGMSVENIINDKETENKGDESVTGMKLKPGEKGSLVFTPGDDKKGNWLTAARTKNGTGSKNGIIIVN